MDLKQQNEKSKTRVGDYGDGGGGAGGHRSPERRAEFKNLYDAVGELGGLREAVE